MNNRIDKTIVITLILFSGLVIGCHKKEVRHVEDTGFLVFYDPDHWIFVPVFSINSENCINDFRTENLKLGIGFPVESVANVSYLKKTLDTLRIENMSPEYPQYMHFLKMTPVKIEYDIQEKFIGVKSQLRSEFYPKINGQLIKINYDQFPVRVNRMTPLFCLNKKELDITECECKHREDDVDDYLFKICNYIKIRDRYSDIPCLYNIKKIEEAILEGRKVIRVELTCCHLGDVAFFDFETKEIVSIAYGAK